MENKTDKPYSLQDAKVYAQFELGCTEHFIETVLKQISIDKYIDEVATVYASKATEELRKANEELKAKIKQQDKEYVSNGSIQEWKDYSERTTAMIERLKESNKELVEALKESIKVTRDYKVGEIKEPLYLVENKTFLKAEKLIQKSEGDVNKKDMKTLLEIQNEVANKLYNQNWMDVELICTASLWPEVCRRAQLECARETLIEAANNARVKYAGTVGTYKGSGRTIVEESITNEANIKLIQ